MQLELTVESHEINEDLLNKIKNFIQKGEGKFKIFIEKEEDETDFLLKNETNRKRLLKAIADAKAGRNFTRFDSIDDLKKSIK